MAVVNFRVLRLDKHLRVLSQMSYFRRSGGRDHIFIFPRYGAGMVLTGISAGAHLFHSWVTYLNNSIILTSEGDRTDNGFKSTFEGVILTRKVFVEGGKQKHDKLIMILDWS